MHRGRGKQTRSWATHKHAMLPTQARARNRQCVAAVHAGSNMCWGPGGKQSKEMVTEHLDAFGLAELVQNDDRSATSGGTSQVELGPNWSDFGPNSAMSGPSWRIPSQPWPKLVECGRQFLPMLTESRTMLVGLGNKCCRMRVKFGRFPAKCGRDWPMSSQSVEVNQNEGDAGPNWPMWAEVAERLGEAGPSSTGFDRFRPKFPRNRPGFSEIWGISNFGLRSEKLHGTRRCG